MVKPKTRKRYKSRKNHKSRKCNKSRKRPKTRRRRKLKSRGGGREDERFATERGALSKEANRIHQATGGGDIMKWQKIKKQNGGKYKNCEVCNSTYKITIIGPYELHYLKIGTKKLLLFSEIHKKISYLENKVREKILENVGWFHYLLEIVIRELKNNNKCLDFYLEKEYELEKMGKVAITRLFSKSSHKPQSTKNRLDMVVPAAAPRTTAPVPTKSNPWGSKKTMAERLRSKSVPAPVPVHGQGGGYFTNGFQNISPEIKNMTYLTNLYTDKKYKRSWSLYLPFLRDENFYYDQNNVRVHHFDMRDNKVNISREDKDKFKYDDTAWHANNYYKDPIDYIKTVSDAKKMSIFTQKYRKTNPKPTQRTYEIEDDDGAVRPIISSIKPIYLPITDEAHYLKWFDYFIGFNDDKQYGKFMKNLIHNINCSQYEKAVAGYDSRVVLPIDLFNKRCLIIRKQFVNFNSTVNKLKRGGITKRNIFDKIYEVFNNFNFEEDPFAKFHAFYMHVSTDVYTFLRMFSEWSNDKETRDTNPKLCRGVNYKQNNIITYAGGNHNLVLLKLITLITDKKPKIFREKDKDNDYMVTIDKSVITEFLSG